VGFVHFSQFRLISHFHSCFAHVLNLAVQDALKTLPFPDEFSLSDIDDDNFRTKMAALERDPAYLMALETDIVARVSTLVGDLRSSGQRREALRQSITDYNRNNPVETRIPVLQLMRQMPTRWSSTFLMIDRWLHLTPVSLHNLDNSDSHVHAIGYQLST
jgi:hypothetical protein